MAWYVKTLRIKDLFNVDMGRIERSKNLKVRYVKTYQILKKNTLINKILKFLGLKYMLTFYKVFKYIVQSDSGSQYTVFIKCSPGFDKKILNNKVQVYCNCADFMYRSAYILNRTDNLYRNKYIDKALGIALTTKPTTVPGGTTVVCKHVYAVLQDFKNNLVKFGLVK